MSGTGHLDLDAADRARLLASATAYAAGRRTYVVGAVSDVIAARDLYEAGYAPQGAPEPPIQHLEPLGDAGDPAWADVYMALVGGAE